MPETIICTLKPELEYADERSTEEWKKKELEVSVTLSSRHYFTMIYCYNNFLFGSQSKSHSEAYIQADCDCINISISQSTVVKVTGVTTSRRSAKEVTADAMMNDRGRSEKTKKSSKTAKIARNHLTNRQTLIRRRNILDLQGIVVSRLPYS
jgi:hypothetical protein